MLSNIRVKFLNVSKNVKFLQNEKTKEENLVNYEAGSEILDHFKREWEILHETNECNARKAAEVADNIEKIYSKINKNKNNVGIITEILTNSNLISSIKGVGRQIGDLYDLCDKVERDLLQLEDVIDEIEFQNLKNNMSIT
ncbi:hypothetical protein HHI36_002229 [Cryptolaemus montrouzieri]|uniref:Uncharacterized protein n=1 Tax=Cryptolaemus montrouzieri TaxID=559131 RepID=A0ABD2P9T7_9CUCU